MGSMGIFRSMGNAGFISSTLGLASFRFLHYIIV